MDPDATGAALVLVDDEDEESEAADANEDVVWVWPECVESVSLFLDTPWIKAGMDAAPDSLNFAEARAQLRDRAVLDHEAFMQDLRVMQAAALEVFGAQAKRRMQRLQDKMRKANNR